MIKIRLEFLDPSCGKSTLFDILLGLIKPIKGQVLINNHDLSKKFNPLEK